jgi:hypothetical protein
MTDLAEWSLLQHVLRCAERNVADTETLDAALDALDAQITRAKTDSHVRAWLLDHMRTLYS